MPENNILSSMEFEKRIKEMPDRELMEFFAVESYKSSLASKKLQGEVYGVDGEPGLKERLNRQELQGKQTWKMTMWVISGIVILAGLIIGLYVQHMAGS